jgi:hypothetical protein
MDPFLRICTTASARRLVRGRVHQNVNRSVFLTGKTGPYTGQTNWCADMRLLSGVISEWYISRFSYQTGLVTPKSWYTGRYTAKR